MKKILSLSLVALVIAIPAVAQRTGSRIVGRSATTARSGTLVDSKGADVRNYRPGDASRTSLGNELIGADRTYQTEADLIYRYDTSDTQLKKAKEAVDKAYTAFIDHCTNNSPNTQASCTTQANEIKNNRVRNCALEPSTTPPVCDVAKAYANPLREDLYSAARYLERVQEEVDRVKLDMGLLGNAVKVEIDEGLKAFRSAYNRARHMCHDSGALEAVRSANNLVAATLALQGVSVVGGAIGAQATKGGSQTAANFPMASYSGCEKMSSANICQNIGNQPGAGCDVSACTSALQAYLSGGAEGNVNTLGLTGNVVGAVGNVGATITSLVARDAFMKAIYRIDDCQRAITQFTALMPNTACPDGFEEECTFNSTTPTTGACNPSSTSVTQTSTGRCVAKATTQLSQTCSFGWAFDKTNNVCVAAAENVIGQTVPKPSCPSGTMLQTPTTGTPFCVPNSIEKSEVTIVTAGVYKIWQGSKAKDSVEACGRVSTGTSRENKWGSAWQWAIDRGSDSDNPVPLQILADNMLYSGLISGVGAAINVAGAVDAGKNDPAKTGKAAATWGAVAGALGAAGFTVPVLLASSRMLYNAERCLESWPETVDEQW